MPPWLLIDKYTLNRLAAAGLRNRLTCPGQYGRGTPDMLLRRLQRTQANLHGGFDMAGFWFSELIPAHFR